MEIQKCNYAEMWSWRLYVTHADADPHLVCKSMVKVINNHLLFLYLGTDSRLFQHWSIEISSALKEINKKHLMRKVSIKDIQQEFTEDLKYIERKKIRTQYCLEEENLKFTSEKTPAKFNRFVSTEILPTFLELIEKKLNPSKHSTITVEEVTGLTEKIWNA